ncbi:chloramphenicol O-acetyltransferase [Prevotella sp. CAG:592]|nr:chloramphenicol O-acetyltransferase [Prevotella sp. CAG:592]
MRQLHNKKISRKRGWKFNMILCWAIGCAASRTREFIFFRKKTLALPGD